MNIIKRILSVLLILTIAFSNIIYADGRDTIEDDDYIGGKAGVDFYFIIICFS